MNRVKYLLGNINPLNILLTGALIFLVNMVFPALSPNMQYSFRNTTPHKEPVSAIDNKPGIEKTTSALDYMVIPEQNLFHPDRKIPVKESQALPKPDFVLYGTMISGDINVAYMEDRKSPYATVGRGQRQKTLKLGHTLSGFVLSDIQHDKVMMVRGEERLEVRMITPRQKKERKGVVKK